MQLTLTTMNRPTFFLCVYAFLPIEKLFELFSVWQNLVLPDTTGLNSNGVLATFTVFESLLDQSGVQTKNSGVNKSLTVLVEISQTVQV